MIRAMELALNSKDVVDIITSSIIDLIKGTGS